MIFLFPFDELFLQIEFPRIRKIIVSKGLNILKFLIYIYIFFIKNINSLRFSTIIIISNVGLAIKMVPPTLF